MITPEKFCLITCADPRYTHNEDGSHGSFEPVLRQIMKEQKIRNPYRFMDFGSSLAINDADKFPKWKKDLEFASKHNVRNICIVDHLEVCAAFVEAYGHAKDIATEISQHEKELRLAAKKIKEILPSARVFTILHDSKSYRTIN